MTYGDYPDLNDVKKILVVKLRQLGDVLLTGAVFSGLRARFPKSQIDAYVYTESFPMLEGHPGVDGLVGYDRGWKKLGLLGRLRKEWSLWRQIRSQGYDLVINLTEGDRLWQHERQRQGSGSDSSQRGGGRKEFIRMW
jgi:heptosyltransferase-3